MQNRLDCFLFTFFYVRECMFNLQTRNKEQKLQQAPSVPYSFLNAKETFLSNEDPF